MNEKRQTKVELAKTGFGMAGTALSLVVPAVVAAKFAPALLVLAVVLGFRTPLSTKRARRVLEAAKKNPGLSLGEMAFRIRTHPDRESLAREVRTLVRDIEDTVESAQIEPLFRIAQQRTVNELSTNEAQRLAALVRSLSGAEVEHLIRLTRAAVRHCNSDPSMPSSVRLNKWHTSTDGNGKHIGGIAFLNSNDILVEDISGTRLFPLLRQYGFGESVDGVGMAPTTNIEIWLHDARKILRVVDA